MTKTIYLLRGASGSGKSTFADSIKNLNPDTLICCADDYFVNKLGDYVFDVSELSEAHTFCKNNFHLGIIEDKNTIVVSNTNTREWEWSFYEDLGRKHGYQIFHIILENRHGGENIHGVPQEVLETQKERILSDIKL